MCAHMRAHACSIKLASACAYMHTWTQARMYARTHACMHACTHTSTHMQAHARMCSHTHICSHGHIAHTGTYAWMVICTRAHKWPPIVESPISDIPNMARACKPCPCDADQAPRDSGQQLVATSRPPSWQPPPHKRWNSTGIGIRPSQGHARRHKQPSHLCSKTRWAAEGAGVRWLGNWVASGCQARRSINLPGNGLDGTRVIHWAIHRGVLFRLYWGAAAP
jgi:hypothetical protein